MGVHRLAEEVRRVWQCVVLRQSSGAALSHAVALRVFVFGDFFYSLVFSFPI